MMILNKTKNEMVVSKTRFADSSWKKFRGLMFEKRERFDYALVFDFGRETQWGASIHMLFVFFPIDLIYLNEKKQVVDLQESVLPWTLNYTPTKPARYLIEMPLENGKKISLGDQLEWK